MTDNLYFPCPQNAQKALLCGSEIGANAISVTGVVVVRIAVVVDISEIGSGVQRLPGVSSEELSSDEKPLRNLLSDFLQPLIRLISACIISPKRR